MSVSWVDEKNETIIDAGLPWKHSITNPLCGAYYSNSKDSYFRVLSCSLKYKAICELVKPKGTKAVGAVEL